MENKINSRHTQIIGSETEFHYLCENCRLTWACTRVWILICWLFHILCCHAQYVYTFYFILFRFHWNADMDYIHHFRGSARFQFGRCVFISAQ